MDYHVRIPKEKIEQVCQDFLMVMPKGKAYSIYSASQAMQKRWGVRIDHHEFVFARDALIQQGMAERVPDSSSSYPKFRIKE